MTTARKVKISISLDARLLDVVDRVAANDRATRSAVMERFLRQAAQQTRVAKLEEETAAYYDSLTADEKGDDAAWASASSRATRRLRVDEIQIVPSPQTARKRPARKR